MEVDGRIMQKQKKHRFIKRILAGFFILLVIVVLVTPLWMASLVMTGERQTLDEAMKWQSEQYDTSFYEKLDKTDYTVSGYEGYTLHVQLYIPKFEQNQGDDDTSAVSSALATNMV